MPRSSRLASRVLPRLGPKSVKADVPRSQIKGPRLYNARRLVQVSQSELWRDRNLQARVETNLKQNPNDQSWRQHVSQDVVQFVDDMEDQGTKLLPEEQLALLRNPVSFFSRPQNVPNSLRNQVYFPDFSITLLHTSRLGPYYARFKVPLWFSKIDLKTYLKSVYNVDVVHIRSRVTYAHMARVRKTPMSRGELERGRSKKFMIVQLVDPFTWPKRPTDSERVAFHTKEYEAVEKSQKEDNRLLGDAFGSLPDKNRLKTIAEQAQDLLAGKTKWSPTWQEVPMLKQKIIGREEITKQTQSGRLLMGLPPTSSSPSQKSSSSSSSMSSRSR